MSYFEWNSDYSLGLPEIDSQHRQLVAILNALHRGVTDGAARPVLARIVSDLVSYTKIHMEAEEDLMRRLNYPEQAAHHAEHVVLLEHLEEVERQLASGGRPGRLPALDALAAMLPKHMLETDQRYGQYVRRKRPDDIGGQALQ